MNFKTEAPFFFYVLCVAAMVCVIAIYSGETAYIAQYQVESYVTLGSYSQTNSGTDNTPIEWLVLENDGETALLISRYALDAQPYNVEYVDNTWEQCTLRGWLNNEFYNRAFSDDDKQVILTSDVSADENPNYGTNPGNATKDRVFLLSIVEAEKYFANDEARICVATEYASQLMDGKEACRWWLRSPGAYSNTAANVFRGGSVLIRGSYLDDSTLAVRPCVRITASELLSNDVEGEKMAAERDD